MIQTIHNYWLVFYTDVAKEIKVYHMIGYEIEPLPFDIAAAIKELVYDPEFGLGQDVVAKLSIKVIPGGKFADELVKLLQAT